MRYTEPYKGGAEENERKLETQSGSGADSHPAVKRGPFEFIEGGDSGDGLGGG